MVSILAQEFADIPSSPVRPVPAFVRHVLRRPPDRADP